MDASFSDGHRLLLHHLNAATMNVLIENFYYLNRSPQTSTRTLLNMSMDEKYQRDIYRRFAYKNVILHVRRYG